MEGDENLFTRARMRCYTEPKTELGDEMKIGVKLGICVLGAGLASQLFGATLASPFDSNYTITNLGSVPDLPTNYGGLVFKAGDPNKILIGGAANGAGGQIREVDVIRDINGDIIG